MADSSVPARPIFDPVDTSFDPNEVSARDDVESPSLSSSNALARFEFEPGKSREGTKVLMVEWEDDATTNNISGDWEIKLDSNKTLFPAREQATAPGEEAPVNRLYFLLGPGVNIPTTIKLSKGSVSWKTNPLPAIFSPELGATSRQAGKKGVLHTIWAKKRLQVLQREIENESKDNVEGIGLEMALAEKEWIEQNFGVLSKPSNIAIPSLQANTASPISPRSPGGGRLMEKLKGLKLGTAPSHLDNLRHPSQHNPLSPETSDVAIGSFGSFAALKGMPKPSSLAAKPAQSPAERSARRVAPVAPPQSFAAQQRHGGSASLSAVASGDTTNQSSGVERGNQDDLFALPMSPKSATVTGQTAFSFTAQDTNRYTKRETA